MKLSILATIFTCALLHGSTNAVRFETAAPFFGQKYADVSMPRTILFDDAGNLLVLARGSSSVVALSETQNSDGTITVNQFTIVDGAGLELNHGMAYHQGYLYASGPTKVYRWPYTPGQQTIITSPPQTVVINMPNLGCCHSTRTLAIDSRGMLYVTLGSQTNVDLNSNRARILTFNMNQAVPEGGINYIFGGVFADGTRNNVGLDFDLEGTLWGVDNGYDNLRRPDLGGDIHQGNPAEELNRYNRPAGTGFGYPYCFTAYNLTGYEPGTQFALEASINDGVHTDDWCRNLDNNQPPILSLRPHTAPVGIEFYDGAGCDEVEGAFPCSAIGDAFISYHGSWDSFPPVGYRVGWVKFNKTTLEPTGEDIDVIYEPQTELCPGPIGSCFRPVNAVFSKDGHLIVSTDVSGELFKVTYNTPPKPIRS